ncbi:MAG: hypothetical protein ACTSU4_02070 [Promethearchaeota archaeon]
MPTNSKIENICPFCKKKIDRPYWAHVQSEHPDEYKKKQTWVKLFKDYISLGMDQEISLQVIAELYNTSPSEVKSFLKQQGVQV